MSLARRLMMSTSVGGASAAPGGQVEYIQPGAYGLIVPAGVESFSAVAIAAGDASNNTTPFNGRRGGNLHWRNSVPCTPGELLLVAVGSGELNVARESSVKRGSDYMLRADNGGILFHPTLGGGGGLGGPGGPGNPGNGGLGGGGPGYTGTGGQGGNFSDSFKGQFAATDSGGGRGGSKTGNPTGWVSETGEGTGLLGRTPDLQSSLGTPRFGAGVWGGPAPTAQSGGVRLVWGGVVPRTYPDNAPDVAFDTPATFISSANGSASGPAAFTFHTSAQPGDLVLARVQFGSGGGSFSGVTGSANWNRTGVVMWKQVTAADIAASAAGTIAFGGSGTMSWITATYRGPRAAVSRTGASDFPPADTVVVPGFTKRIDCQRVVTIAADPDTASISTPSGFTSRGARTSPLAMRLSDIAPASYVNGASVTYTGMGSTSGASAYLLELY